MLIKTVYHIDVYVYYDGIYICVSTRSINILIMIMLMTFFWGRGQKYNTTADVFEYLSSKKKIYMKLKLKLIFKILFGGGGEEYTTIGIWSKI